MENHKWSKRLKISKKLNNGKACGLDEIPADVWKLENVQSILLIFCNSLYDKQKIKRWTEGCVLPFPKRETSL